MLFLIKVEEISTMERQLNVLLGDFKSELSDSDESTGLFDLCFDAWIDIDRMICKITSKFFHLDKDVKLSFP
jgi:hypothetical protein